MIWIKAFICLFFPTRLVWPVLKVMGWNISKNAKIGFSLILTEELNLEGNSSIGSLNLIKLHKLSCSDGAKIGHGNRTRGKISLKLKKNGAIGNFNIIVKAPPVVKNTISILTIGENSKITSRHYIDCLSDITLHQGVVVGGVGSQLWTHGYYHYSKSLKRVRVDGSIEIGDFVYIGSHCVINPGIKICSGVSIGSHSSISKSITESGLYVSQSLRRVQKSPEETFSNLERGDDGSSIEEYYVKK